MLIFSFIIFSRVRSIPTFIMIGLWGGRDRRSIALEITIYLTLGALISLGGLVAINVLVDSPKFDFPTYQLHSASPLLDSTAYNILGILLLGLVFSLPFFLFILGLPVVMMPAYLGFHAPCWGFEKVRSLWINPIAIPLFPDAIQCWSPWVMWLALGNILIVGFVTIAQTNFKSMISYGSVMHMGYCFLGIGACSALGAGSAVMLMCAHGLSVALMFLLASFVRKRTSTDEMTEMGGLAEKTPLLACFCMAGTLATIGLPGFGNFWVNSGSFCLLVSLVKI